MSHLCTILIDQSDIVKVIVFFEPSQCSFQTAQTGTGTTVHTYLEYLEICSSYLDFANILQFSYLVNLMILVKMAIFCESGNSGDYGKSDISTESSKSGISNDSQESGDSGDFLETHNSGSGESGDSGDFGDTDDSVDPGDFSDSGEYGKSG